MCFSSRLDYSESGGGYQGGRGGGGGSFDSKYNLIHNIKQVTNVMSIYIC